jgi:hypothetical protein
MIFVFPVNGYPGCIGNGRDLHIDTILFYTAGENRHNMVDHSQKQCNIVSSPESWTLPLPVS